MIATPRAISLVTAPTIEPVTLTEAKEHLRIDTQSFAAAIATTQSLEPDEYAVGTHTGTGVDVQNSRAIVNLDVGVVAATGTVDVTVQESSDDATYTAWATFTQVTPANDQTLFEKEYTGSRQYIRVVAVVANAVASFSASVVTYDATETTEDTYITNLITTARKWCESYQDRAYITQTWDAVWDRWPRGWLSLPLAPLQSVTSVKHYGTDDTEYTSTSTLYQVDTYSNPGRIAPAYSQTWPTETLRPMAGVVVRFVAGYGDATTDVPDQVRQAIMMLVAEMYERREAGITGQTVSAVRIGLAELLWQEKLNIL